MLFSSTINIKICHSNVMYVKYDEACFMMYSLYRLSLHFLQIIRFKELLLLLFYSQIGIGFNGSLSTNRVSSRLF